jgi:type IX secretion system PorP/SprF family membrane protein
MKNKIFILATALIVSATGFAQTGAPLASFSGNQILYNPGYAGIYEMMVANLTYRNQWGGFSGSPTLLSLNAATPIQNQRHSLGLIYQREEWGPNAGNYVYGNYAFKVYTKHGVLNFGVQPGLLNYSTNWSKFGTEEDGYVQHWDDDGLFTRAQTRFDLNTGVFFLHPSWYAGVSAKHVTAPKFDKITIDDERRWSRVHSDWFLIAGYHFDFNENWSIRPEAQWRYVYRAPNSVDIGAHVYYMNDFSLGANFSTGMKTLDLNARAMISRHLRIGYSYGIPFGRIANHQRGSHEIMINYYFWDIWWDTHNMERLQWH